MSTQPVDEQHRQREQNALTQVRNAKDVRQLVKHLLPHLYRYNLKLAARLGDLFLGRLGKLVRADGDRDREFTVAQNLDRILGLDYPGLAQHVGSDRGLAELDQPLQADDVELLAENIGEAALRHAAVQRHLAAFKPADHARSGARTLSLVPAGGRLAHPRTHAAPYALALLGRL